MEQQAIVGGKKIPTVTSGQPYDRFSSDCPILSSRSEPTLAVTLCYKLETLRRYGTLAAVSEWQRLFDFSPDLDIIMQVPSTC